MSYYGTEDYGCIGRRHSPQTNHNKLRRSAHYLNPGVEYSSGGRHSSGSCGYAWTQFDNSYGGQVQKAKLRADRLNSSLRRPYPTQPELRGQRLGDENIGDFADIALLDNVRSRSHRRSEEAGFLVRPDLSEWRLAQKEDKIEDFKRKQLWEKECELQKMKDRAKKKAEAEEAEEEKKRVISEYEAKKRKDAEHAKAEEIRIKEKLERETREAKEKEERDWAEFLRKRSEIEEKRKMEKKQAEEKFAAEMRKRLSKFGYTENQIDILVDGERAKQSKEGQTMSRSVLSPDGTLDVWKLRRPVYAKVHRDYLSVHTLICYNIPYDYDKSDPNFIIIFREIDGYEAEILFEHTKRLREAKLLLETPKDRLQYAWYRRRSRTRSRVPRIGIL